MKLNKKTRLALIRLIAKLGLVAIVIICVLTFVFGIYPLHGNNMYPALRDGDLCITYKLDSVHTGDVVAYKKNDQICFGRVIASEGDNVLIDDAKFQVNGLIPSESIYYETTAEETVDLDVGEGEVFILNDFRSDTDDSRSYGCINIDDIQGKVSFVFRRRGF